MQMTEDQFTSWAAEYEHYERELKARYYVRIPEYEAITVNGVLPDTSLVPEEEENALLDKHFAANTVYYTKLRELKKRLDDKYNPQIQQQVAEIIQKEPAKAPLKKVTDLRSDLFWS